MVARTHARTGDGGFSLPEMITVVALVGLVLAVSFGGMRAVYAGRSTSDRQAWFAREIGQPLARLETVLTQNIDLEAATPYSVTVIVDRPRQVGSTLVFDNVERHVITATTDGRVREEVYSTDTLRQNVALLRTVDWSLHNANQATGQAMFSFLDVSGAPVTPESAPEYARSAVVKIVTVRDNRSLAGTRTVFFRNR